MYNQLIRKNKNPKTIFARPSSISRKFARLFSGNILEYSLKGKLTFNECGGQNPPDPTEIN